MKWSLISGKRPFMFGWNSKILKKVPINEVDDVANQPLWNNAFVQFKNKSLFYRNWLESGYVCVGDLFIEDSLVSLEHIMTFMGPDPSLPLQYHALYNALPAAWRDPATIENMDPHSEPTFRDQRLSSLTARDIRVSLVKDRICTPCCVNFWERKFPNTTINKDIFMRVISATKETRLRVLHWKMTHNICPTNILLYKMGISDTSNCQGHATTKIFNFIRNVVVMGQMLFLNSMEKNNFQLADGYPICTFSSFCELVGYFFFHRPAI